MPKEPSRSIWIARTTDVMNRRWFLGLTVAGGAAVLSGCGLGGGGNSKGPEDMLAWPLDDVWPARVEEAHPEMAEAYKWVAVNKETAQWFPCTCGCVDTDDHTSNYDCFVAEEYDDGSVLLDPLRKRRGTSPTWVTRSQTD